MGAPSNTSIHNTTFRFLRSCYVDPFKWSLVKSISLFAVAILVAREMTAASVEPAA